MGEWLSVPHKSQHDISSHHEKKSQTSAPDIVFRGCPGDDAVRGTIITGTGRAGTSFLMAVLTALKMPTGFSAADATHKLDTPFHAGLELTPICNCFMSTDLPKPVGSCLHFSNSTEIIKGPALAMEDSFPLWLSPPLRSLSNVVVPVRSSAETSRSRAANAAAGHVEGAFWGGAQSANEQQRLDEHLLSTLVVQLTKHGIPTTLLYFPKFALSAEYCADKLSWLYRRYGISRQEFLVAHRAISNASLVHSSPHRALRNASLVHSSPHRVIHKAWQPTP